MFKANNNKDDRKRSIRSSYSFFNVNFEHIWYIILVSPLLTLNKWNLMGPFRKFPKTRIQEKFDLALILAYWWRYVSLKYILNILFSPWTRITYAFFRRNLSLDTLAVTKICSKFLNVKIRFSHILITWKRFHNPPATQEIKL